MPKRKRGGDGGRRILRAVGWIVLGVGVTQLCVSMFNYCRRQQQQHTLVGRTDPEDRSNIAPLVSSIIQVPAVQNWHLPLRHATNAFTAVQHWLEGNAIVDRVAQAETSTMETEQQKEREARLAGEVQAALRLVKQEPADS
jgi:hypothetical protein